MHIFDMPNELLLWMVASLSILDLYNFCSTCRQISALLGSRLRSRVVVDEDGTGVLKWAVKHGHGPLAELAISLGADMHIRYDAEGTADYGWRNLLDWAAFYGHSNIIHILFKHGARVDDEVFQLVAPGSLHMAAVNGRSEAAKALLELGADMTIVNEDNEMPAHIAARGSISCLQAFIDAGFDLNTKGCYQGTVLHIAAQFASVEMMEYLLEKEEMKKAVNDQSCLGHTPLHLAILNSDNVKLLLHHGADMKARDYFGMTPTHRAACGSISGLDPESLRTLIDAGFDLSIRARSGRTVLHYAAEFFQQQDVMEYLVKQPGVIVNAQDSRGVTPLALAMDRCPSPEREWMISLLIQYGADLDIKDNLEKTTADRICQLKPKFQLHRDRYLPWEYGVCTYEPSYPSESEESEEDLEE